MDSAASHGSRGQPPLMLESDMANAPQLLTIGPQVDQPQDDHPVHDAPVQEPLSAPQVPISATISATTPSTPPTELVESHKRSFFSLRACPESRATTESSPYTPARAFQRLEQAPVLLVEEGPKLMALLGAVGGELVEPPPPPYVEEQEEMQADFDKEAEDGMSDWPHEIETKVEDLEKKLQEMHSQLLGTLQAELHTQNMDLNTFKVHFTTELLRLNHDLAKAFGELKVGSVESKETLQSMIEAVFLSKFDAFAKHVEDSISSETFKLSMRVENALQEHQVFRGQIEQNFVQVSQSLKTLSTEISEIKTSLGQIIPVLAKKIANLEKMTHSTLPQSRHVGSPPGFSHSQEAPPIFQGSPPVVSYPGMTPSAFGKVPPTSWEAPPAKNVAPLPLPMDIDTQKVMESFKKLEVHPFSHTPVQPSFQAPSALPQVPAVTMPSPLPQVPTMPSLLPQVPTMPAMLPQVPIARATIATTSVAGSPPPQLISQATPPMAPMWQNNSVAMLVATQPPPEQFSGTRGDYPSFRSGWMRHKSILEMSGTLPDSFLLARLEPLLDVGSRAVLKSELERNANLRHSEFWSELDKCFMAEGPISSRQNWEELQIMSLGKLNPQTWRHFYADFRRLQNRVVDATDNEAVRLLRQRLPERAADRVESEFRRQKKSAKMLSVQGISCTETEMAQWILALTGNTPHTVEKVQNGEWKINCASEGQKMVLAAHNNRPLSDGTVLKVAPLEYCLTPDSVFKVVLEFLEERQTCDDFKKAPRRITRVEERDCAEEVIEVAAAASKASTATSSPSAATTKTPQGQPNAPPQKGESESKKNWDSRRKKFWSKKPEKNSNPPGQPSNRPAPPHSQK